MDNKKKNIKPAYLSLILLALIIFIFGMIYVWRIYNTKMVDYETRQPVSSVDREQVVEENKIYDWNIRLVLCKDCDPYTQEYISQNELEKIKDEMISNFEESEVVFDKFSNEDNSLYIKATYEAKDKIEQIKFTGFNIKTIYYDVLIDEELQKNPLGEQDIYVCTQNRDCVSVSSGCCGCSSGGQATAVNREYYNYWKEKSLKKCGIMTVCPTVISNHWSCYSKPTCVNDVCQMVK